MGVGVDWALDLILEERRDADYDSARYRRDPTWQRVWWLISADTEGLILSEVARAWSCSIENLLAPVAERNWGDRAQLPGLPAGVDDTAWVLRLRRPG